jgi:5-(carboxyamino)imidazole ribonucleotide synthase
LLAIIQGDLMDFETVYNFGKSGCINFWNWTRKSWCTFKTWSRGIKVYPSPKTLQLIQNKGTQKILHKTRYTNSKL